MSRSTNSPPRQDRSAPVVVESYIDAHERRDYERLVELLSSDVRLSLPDRQALEGRPEVGAFFEDALGAGAPGDYRLVPVSYDGQLAVANHVRRPGDFAYVLIAIDVLSIVAGQIREITVHPVDELAGRDLATAW